MCLCLGAAVLGSVHPDPDLPGGRLQGGVHGHVGRGHTGQYTQ